MSDPVRTRRAIYTALLPLVSKRRLFEALWLWEQKYSVSGKTELRKFVDDIAEATDSKDFLQNINQSLIKSVYFTSQQLLKADPHDMMLQFKAKANGEFAFNSSTNADAIRLVKSPETIIFEQVLLQFLVQIKQSNPLKFEYFCYRIDQVVRKLKMSKDQHKEFSLWIRKQNNSLSEKYQVSLMKSILNLIYVAACESCGPVNTDKMLSSSIKKAGELSEAELFSPQNLL